MDVAFNGAIAAIAVRYASVAADDAQLRWLALLSTVGAAGGSNYIHAWQTNEAAAGDSWP